MRQNSFLIGLSFFWSSFTPLLSLAQSTRLVLTHVNVIDMTGAKTKFDMTVIIVGNKIFTIAKTGKVRVPKNVQLINASGKYLIPGLWDMHVHFAISGNEESFPMYISNGVTGVRDMGGNMDTIIKWRQTKHENLLIPRIVGAGPILDGKTPGWPLRVSVETASQGKKVVDSLKNRGVDFIKVHNLLSREAYFAIASEATKQRIPFAGHVPYSITAIEASNSGQKSIEHLTGLPSVYNDVKAKALFALFVKNKTWQCPTLIALRAIAFLNDSNFRNNSQIKYISPTVMESWNFQINTFFINRTPEAIATAKIAVQGNITEMGVMYKAGVDILAGTDVGFPYIFPGFSLHEELALLVQAGLTPMQALQTATSNPAKYLKTIDSLGTVQKGKIADLVLLEANPLDNINNTQKITAVILDGKYLPKELLKRTMPKY